MKKSYLLTIIFIWLFYSCEKDNLNLEDFQGETLIRHIGNSEEDMRIITYYNTGLVQEDLNRFIYNKFIYNEKEQLERLEIARSVNPLSCAIIPGTGFESGEDPRKAKPSEIHEFQYNENGKLLRQDHYFMGNEQKQLMVYITYEYDQENIVKLVYYIPTGEMSHYTTFEYDENSNVIEVKSYGKTQNTEFELQNKSICEYDNKLNPFKVFQATGYPGVFTNTNNITREIHFNYYGDEVYSDTIVNTYEYNDIGYPVEVNDIKYRYGEVQ